MRLLIQFSDDAIVSHSHQGVLKTVNARFMIEKWSLARLMYGTGMTNL